MAITAIIGTSSSSTSVSAPAGIQNNDILVLFETGNAPNTPVGWTQLINNGSAVLSWKRTTGSESSVSLGAFTSGVIVAYRGCSTDVNPFGQTGNSASSPLSFTPQQSASMIIEAAYSGVNGVSMVSSVTGETLTDIGLISNQNTVGKDTFYWNLHPYHFIRSSQSNFTISVTDTPALVYAAELKDAGAGSGTTYNDSLTEPASASEALGSAATFASSCSETVTASESLGTTATFVSSASEAATASDTVTGERIPGVTTPTPTVKVTNSTTVSNTVSATGLTTSGASLIAIAVMTYDTGSGDPAIGVNSVTVGGSAATSAVDFGIEWVDEGLAWFLFNSTGALNNATVTATLNRTCDNLGIVVVEVAGGSVTVGDTGTGTDQGATMSASIVATADNSLVLCAFISREAVNSHPGTNSSELADYVAGVNYAVGKSTQTVSTGNTYTVTQISDSGGWQWGAAAIEIKPAGVGNTFNESVTEGASASDTVTGALQGQTYDRDLTESLTLAASVGSSLNGTNPKSPTTDWRFSALVSPSDGETFIGSTIHLRLTAACYDSNNYQAGGPGGGGNKAAECQFLVDGTNVLTVAAANAEAFVFPGFASVALSPGEHTVVARAIYTTNPGPADTIDSLPFTIYVEAAPTYDKTITLSGNMTVAQLLTAASGSLVGTANARIKVDGQDLYRVVDGVVGAAIDWRYVDFYNMGPVGSLDNLGTPGVDVTTSSNVTIKNCRFDYSGSTRLEINGTATAEIRDNLWRSNMRQNIHADPYDFGTAGRSNPAIWVRGSSTAAKQFAGNNVGAGWLDLATVNNWLVGGDYDADSNIFIGPRAGIFLDFGGTTTSPNVVIKRCFSHHVYYGGWSQGSNLEVGGNTDTLVEHNVFIGSSWTLRGISCEFRYNTTIYGGEDWMWCEGSAFIHHNLFIGGDLNRSGILSNPGAGNTARILNNTFDGINGTQQFCIVAAESGTTDLKSNVVMNHHAIGGHSPIELNGGTLTPDYNTYYNVSRTDAPTTRIYEDGRATPANDAPATDPRFADPSIYMYEFSSRSIWKRLTSVPTVIHIYRGRYTPLAGSPVLDAGDTTDFGTGNFRGAIGDGTNAYDLFGVLPNVAYSDSVTEQVSAGAAFSAGQVFNESLTEPVTATVAASSAWTGAVALSESITASDSQTSAATFTNAVSAPASATDALSSATVFVSPLSEAITSGETLAALASFLSSVSETASTLDTVTGATVGGLTVNLPLDQVNAELPLATSGTAGLGDHVSAYNNKTNTLLGETDASASDGTWGITITRWGQ